MGRRPVDRKTRPPEEPRKAKRAARGKRSLLVVGVLVGLLLVGAGV